MLGEKMGRIGLGYHGMASPLLFGAIEQWDRARECPISQSPQVGVKSQTRSTLGLVGHRLGLVSATWNADLTSGRPFRCPQAAEIRLRLPLVVHTPMKSEVSIPFLSSPANPLGLNRMPGEMDEALPSPLMLIPGTSVFITSH